MRRAPSAGPGLIGEEPSSRFPQGSDIKSHRSLSKESFEPACNGVLCQQAQGPSRSLARFDDSVLASMPAMAIRRLPWGGLHLGGSPRSCAPARAMPALVGDAVGRKQGAYAALSSESGLPDCHPQVLVFASSMISDR